MRSSNSTSAELDALIEDLTPYRGFAEVTLSGGAFDVLVERLTVIRKLARLDENELGGFRLGEAGRLGRATVEQLAGEAMGNMMFDTTEKVVRPDFRGKRS